MQFLNKIAFKPEAVSTAKFLIGRNRTETQIIAAIRGEFPYIKNTDLELFGMIDSLKYPNRIQYNEQKGAL